MKKADKEGSAVVVPVAADLTSKEKRRRDLNLLMIEAKVPMYLISIHTSRQPDKRCLINVYVHAFWYMYKLECYGKLSGSFTFSSWPANSL